MRTRRSLTTALALTIVLAASSVSAATRDASPNPSRPDRPSIVAKIKKAITGIIKAFEGPSIPIP